MPAWTWQWHPHVDVWALTLGLAAAYTFALRVIGPRSVAFGESIATRAQKRNFALALAAILVSSDWPMHDLAEGYLYSVHMVWHMLITLAAAPLLLAGMPAWLVRRMLPGRAMNVARALSRPLMGLIIFNAVTVWTHWPNLVNAAAGNEILHLSLHAILLVSAMIMWMPVLSPVLEIPRLSYPGQMLYLFLQSLVPTVPASFLTFGDRPLYAVYTHFPDLWGITDLSDQRTAGLLMKLVGGGVLWAFIAVIFFKWSSMEHAEGVDLLEMHAVETTLTKMELRNR